MLVIVVYMNCELVNFKFSLYNYVANVHALSLTWRLVSVVKFPIAVQRVGACTMVLTVGSSELYGVCACVNGFK